jgi:hypothetical protein
MKEFMIALQLKGGPLAARFSSETGAARQSGPHTPAMWFSYQLLLGRLVVLIKPFTRDPTMLVQCLRD